MQHKVDCHLNRIAFVHAILPFSKIVTECAAFDTQKLKNPDISGKDNMKRPDGVKKEWTFGEEKA